MLTGTYVKRSRRKSTSLCTIPERAAVFGHPHHPPSTYQSSLFPPLSKAFCLSSPSLIIIISSCFVVRLAPFFPHHRLVPSLHHSEFVLYEAALSLLPCPKPSCLGACSFFSRLLICLPWVWLSEGTLQHRHPAARIKYLLGYHYALCLVQPRGKKSPTDTTKLSHHPSLGFFLHLPNPTTT